MEGTNDLTETQIEVLTDRIRYADENYSKAKSGYSVNLSMAYAVARFGLKLYNAVVHGVTHIECAYVSLLDDTEGAKYVEHIAGQLGYFTVPVVFGRDGIKVILPIGNVSTFEYALLQSALPELKRSTENGLAFG